MPLPGSLKSCHSPIYSREVFEIEDSLEEALTLKNKGQIQSIHPIMLTFPLPFPLVFFLGRTDLGKAPSSLKDTV